MTVFDFEDGGWLNDLDAVPLAFGDLHTVVALGGVEEVSLGLCAYVVVEHHEHLAAQDNIGFSRMAMSVYEQRSAWQQHIDEQRRLCIKTIAKVIVHMETMACLCLSGCFVMEFIVD